MGIWDERVDFEQHLIQFWSNLKLCIYISQYNLLAELFFPRETSWLYIADLPWITSFGYIILILSIDILSHYITVYHKHLQIVIYRYSIVLLLPINIFSWLNRHCAGWLQAPRKAGQASGHRRQCCPALQGSFPCLRCLTSVSSGTGKMKKPCTTWDSRKP